MQGTIPANRFIDLLKRAIKSGYGEHAILHERMLLSCYDPDEDGSIGFHYVQHIPKTDDYDDPFYKLTLSISPNKIVEVYNTHTSDLTELRKSKSLKPKDAKILLRYVIKDSYIQLTFEYMLENNIEYSSSVAIPYPVDMNSYEIELLIRTYDTLLNRIDLDYPAIVIDGIRSGLVEKALGTVRVYYLPLKIWDMKIRIPLIRSMLNGNKKFDVFKITVRKTTLKDIFMYSIHYEMKGFTEEFIGYIQNF